MTIKQQIWRMMSPSFGNRMRKVYNTWRLRSIRRVDCVTDKLISASGVDLKNIFNSKEMEEQWIALEERTKIFSIPDGTGGVNFGDRRAIYCLVCKLKAYSVLEIGTHIGASTLHIASALSANRIQEGKNVCLVSVDNSDVNDPASKPWLKYNSGYSPIEMINKMNFGSFVEFVNAAALDYMASCEKRFDLIFLDGSHRADMVYREIPRACNLLNENGTILLHDYFPDLKPLWRNGLVISGPFLAVERLDST